MKTWEPVKARIYDLYIGQGLSLVQVREVLAREEGFEACTRSYRAQISKWGWLKNNHHNNQNRDQNTNSTLPSTNLVKQLAYSPLSTSSRKKDSPQSEQSGDMPHFPTLTRTASFSGGSDHNGIAVSLPGTHNRHYTPTQRSNASVSQQRSFSNTIQHKAAYLGALPVGNSPTVNKLSPSDKATNSSSSGNSSNNSASSSISPMSSPEDRQRFSPRPQFQQRQLYQKDGFPGQLGQKRMESVVVILDNHGLNKSRQNGSQSVIFPPKQEIFAAKENRILEVENGEEQDDERVEVPGVEELENEEERRRYLKRQRHRSVIDVDGVHEIRFGFSSASTSASSSPRSSAGDGEYTGADGEMLDSGDDDSSKDMDLDKERNVKDEEDNRILEEMNMYTAGMRNPAFRNLYANNSPRLAPHDNYPHVLSHKSPTPVPNPLSPRLMPNSPRISSLSACTKISRVASPFQRISSPFMRATGAVNVQSSGYLEIRETIPQAGAQPNMSQFAKISDWLLVLINGTSRSLPMQLNRITMPEPSPVIVKNLSILYHPQPPPGGNGSVHLGTIPTIHAQDPSGKSPLHIAIKHRLPLEVISLLVELGGNIAGKDDQDVNCLHEALQLAPPASTSNSPVMSRPEWTKTYLLPLVQLLLTASASNNQEEDVDGDSDTEPHSHPLVNEPMGWSSESPIHVALKNHQDVSVIRLLIESGASVSGTKDVFGSTPLHILCQTCSPATIGTDMPKKSALVDLLLENGAAVDTDSKTADGHTPLHYAIKVLYTSLTPPPATGNTVVPISLTSTSDNIEVVELLLNKGKADVSIRNGEGLGAVEMASLALAGRVEVDCASDNESNMMQGLMMLGRVVRLLVRAERERFLKQEDERARRLQ